MGAPYNNMYGEKVIVGQAAYLAEPVYGVNAYANNTGMGANYYSGNNANLLLVEEDILITRQRRRNAGIGVVLALFLGVTFFLIFWYV